jgi:outer membrane immunogenic protein
MKITDMRYKLVAVAFAGMAMSGSAFAQSTSWAGPYLGGSIGIASMETKMFDPDEELTGSATSGRRSFTPSLGIFGGYNWQSGTLVYGVDATADLHRYRPKLEGDDVAVGHERFEIKHSASLSVKGRVGTVVGNSLAYVSGGVVWGRFKSFIEDHSSFGNSSKWVPGLAVGVGLDTMYSKDMMLRFQVELRDYARQNLKIDNGDSFGQTPSSVSLNFGVAKKF